MAGIKGKLPHFTAAAGKLFRRSDFLNSVFQTYFGPGQQPDVATLPGSPLASAYYPPNDWRPAGGLLTAPQVVWLTLAQIDAATPSYVLGTGNYAVLMYVTWPSISETIPTTYTWSDGTSITISSVAEAVSLSSNPGTPYLSGIIRGQGNARYAVVDGTDTGVGASNLVILPPSSATVSNVFASDYATLSSTFAQAAATINNLRPEKTWVQVVDYTTGSDAYKAYQKAGYTGPNGPSFAMTYPNRSDLIAPPQGQDFFGTDFLQIHTGAWDTFQNPVFLNTFQPFNGGAGAAYSQAFVDAGEANVKAAYAKFVRWSTWLYTAPPMPFGYPPFQPIGTVGSPGGGYTFEVLQEDVNVLNGNGDDILVPASQMIADFNAYRLNAYNTVKAQQPGLPSGLSSYLQQIASDLQDYGYTYQGLESQLFDPDVVVKMIADYFGFDPGTGLDL